MHFAANHVLPWQHGVDFPGIKLIMSALIAHIRTDILSIANRSWGTAMKIFRYGAAVCAALLGATANAAILTYDYSGTTMAPLHSDPFAGAGQQFSGSFTYDTNTPLFEDESSNYGQYKIYNAVIAATFQSGVLSFTYNTPYSISGIIDALYGSFGRADVLLGNVGPFDNGFYLILIDSSAQRFTSSDLPQAFDLATFDTALVMGFSNATAGEFRGEVTSLTLASAISSAPEPAGWATMLAGFAMLGARLRAHRRRSHAFGTT